jgi:hypothetical protein
MPVENRAEGHVNHRPTRRIRGFWLLLADEDHRTSPLCGGRSARSSRSTRWVSPRACRRAVRSIAIHDTGREHWTSPATAATQSPPCSGPGTESITPPERRLHRVVQSHARLMIYDQAHLKVPFCF